MTIAFDKTTEVAPRTNVNLQVNADHNSFVAVLVVDQSVKLLKEGNDITKDRVSLCRQVFSFPKFMSLCSTVFALNM